MAIVHASYFSSLMLDVERRYLHGKVDTFATFELTQPNMITTN